jgi:hypothetical protein
MNRFFFDYFSQKYCLKCFFLFVLLLATNLSIVSKVQAQAQPSADKPLVKEVYEPPVIEPYKKADLNNLAQLSVLMGGVKLDNQGVMADYARLFYCQIYQDFFDNDYEWLRISQAIKDDFQAQKKDIGKSYYFVTDLVLRRYDPATSSFPLHGDSRLKNIGVFEIYKAEQKQACGSSFPISFPDTYSLNIETPINFDRIPVKTEHELRQISKIPILGYNQTRIVKAVFYFEVKGVLEPGRVKGWTDKMVNFLGELDRVVIFSDDRFSETIYEQKYR